MVTFYSSGAGAYLLESTDKSNRYKLNIGNLPAGKKAEVHFSYVLQMTASHDGWLFSIPETIFPTHRSYLSSIEGRVDVGEEVSSIEVLSDHPIKTDSTGFKYTREEPAFGISSEMSFCIKLKSLEPARETTKSSAQELTKPTLVIEHHLHDPTLFATMLDFRPVFSSNTPELASDYEFVVLADCGGAMYGPKMAQQINALKLLVHSLPSGCKFNLLTVSENYVSQWQTSVVLDEDNMKKAIWAIDHLSADRGGETRLRAALNSVYVRRDYLRNLCVFVLTAIDYSAEARALTKLVSANAARNSRLFAIGFGDEVDSELLNGLAFSGRGRAHFVKDDDFVDGVLFQQLVAAFAPRVRDIKVMWDVDKDSKAKFVDQAPLHVPITASGASTVVYGLFEVPVPEGVEIPPPEDPAAVRKKQREEAEEAKAKPSSSSSAISKNTSSVNLPNPSDAISDAVATAVTSSGTAATKSASSTNVSKKAPAKPSDAPSAPVASSSSSVQIPTATTTTVSSATSPKSARKSKAKKSDEPAVPELPLPTLFPGLKWPITGVTITGIGPDNKELKWEIPVSEASFRGMNRMIRCRAASAVCQEYTTSARTALMSPEQIKLKITDLSTRFQVISKYTSFVAVEERDGEATDTAMKQVNIAANEQKEEPEQQQILNPPPIKLWPPVHYPPRPVRIRPAAHWSPPPPPAPAVHYAPQRSITVSAAKSTYTPSFASDKIRKKLYQKEKSDSAASRSSSSSGLYDPSAASLLGFALRSSDLEDGFSGDSAHEEGVDELVSQAPMKYRLAAPPASFPAPMAPGGVGGGRGSSAPSNAAAAPKQDQQVATLSRGREEDASSDASSDEDMKKNVAESKRELNFDVAPVGTLSPVEKEKRAAGKKELVGEGVAPRRLAKTSKSAYDDDTMIPNKDSLSQMTYEAPPPPPEKHYVSMQPPSDWKFTAEVLGPEPSHPSSSSSSSTSPRDHSTPASRLRAIVNTQHADGSWDLETVSRLLRLDCAALESANPLTHHGGSKSKGKRDNKKGRKGHKDQLDSGSANEPSATSSSATEDHDSSAAAELKSSNPSDVWATALLLAHLKRSYDAERDFWTFVALKVAALLSAAIPDEPARTALLKKAKKYLDSLPIATSSSSHVSVSP